MISDQKFDRGMLTLKVIWLAMLMSLVIYLFVGLYVGANVQSSINEDSLDILRVIFYMLSFAILMATRVVRRLILKGKRYYQAATLQTSSLQRYLTAMIVALTMSETMGIFGLVLFLLGKNSIDLYLLVGVSAAAMIMYRPRKEEMIILAQEKPEDSTAGGTVS
ncbi:MAG: hypothetical protein A4E63_01284 [Syntrophorhabdus sp. PtaU1.Bin050]|nr:MAG: hypothetical protein A4E63_01284 [Syntrophorhabdus sp. PtaU1.Bin050]